MAALSNDALQFQLSASREKKAGENKRNGKMDISDRLMEEVRIFLNEEQKTRS